MSLLQIPSREDFVFIPGWMGIALYLGFLVASLAFAYGVYARSKPVGLRNLVNAYFGDLTGNMRFIINQWLLQRRLMMKRYSGSMHLTVFFGTLVLLAGTILVFIQQDILKPLGIWILIGDAYLIFEVILDAFGVVLIVGLVLALWRRTIVRPEYLENRRWDYVILMALFYLGITGFVLEGVRLTLKPVPWGYWSFVGIRLADLFAVANMSPELGILIYEGLWLSHAAMTFALAIVLPYSTLFHIVLSSANVLKTRISPVGKIKTPFKLADITRSGDFVKVGFNTIQELPWDRKLMLIACTNCGRCQADCPATAAGRALNPRLVMQHLGAQAKQPEVDWSRGLLQRTVTDEEVWGCTMCGACVAQCPVLIRKPDFLIDLRRYLVANGRTDPNMNSLLNNLQNYGNPYGAPSQDRDNWLQNLGVKTFDEDSNVEYLYWVGCAAAFNPRIQKVAKATVALFQKAGISFGVLGDKEKCTGEMVRRFGEEGLFQQLASENIATLRSYGVKKIVTHCPHCYNTLKNEYPEFGGSFEVYHHTQLLAKLVKQGDLAPRKISNIPVVIHDSCYLGRYNGIYDQPREIANSTGAVELQVTRARQASFCCGAGGANFWYAVPEKTRMSDLRLRDFSSTHAKTIVVECPFCLSMFEESQKTSNASQKVEVKDIAEILLEAL